MPLIEDDDPSLPDPTRLSFRERLRGGRVVPIVSNRAIFDRMLGGYEPFLAGYARYVKSPLSLEQPDSLVTVVKFHKHRPREKSLTDQVLKYDYLNYVKNHLYRQAKAEGADQDMLDEAVAEQLVEDMRQVRVAGQKAPVRGQYLEPVQLQVVCYQL